MAIFYGSQWKATLNSYVRYFAGFIEYEITETISTYTLNIVRIGLENVSGGTTKMESSRTADLEIKLSNGTVLGTISTTVTADWAYPSTAHYQFSFPNTSKTITIPKTENEQNVVISLKVSKPGGSGFRGTSTGTLTLPIAAWIRPSVSLAIERASDTTASVTATVTSYVGDNIRNFIFTYGGTTQTLTGGAIPSSGVITRTINLSGISSNTVACTLKATGDGGDSSVITANIPTAFRTFHFGGRGKSIAFGQPAVETNIPSNGRFDCAMDANFTGKVTGISSVKRELLWSQTPVSTNAGSKTLSKDITNYDVIQVVFVDQASDLTYRFVEVPATVGAMGVVNAIWNLSNTSNIYFLRRAFTLAASSVEFKIGEYKNSGSMTTARTAAGYLIPIEIYGIKY